jgi:hypothetical protein
LGLRTTVVDRSHLLDRASLVALRIIWDAHVKFRILLDLRALVHPTTNVRAFLDAAFLMDNRLSVVATKATCLSTAVGMVPMGLKAAMMPDLVSRSELSSSSAHALGAM